MELVEEIPCKITHRDTGAEQRWQLFFLKLKCFELPHVRNEEQGRIEAWLSE